MPSKASFIVKIKSKQEILKVHNFAEKVRLPLLVLGGGTNIVPHSHLKAIVVYLDFKGIKMNKNRLEVQAGEEWDNVVLFAVKNNLTGIEALSWIPGKAGAAPIQNIGAYGSELADTLEKVEAYDKEKKKMVTFNKKACKFGYRNSLFKDSPTRFIVTAITLKLSKKQPKIPQYEDVKKYFLIRKNKLPSLKEIRKAIIKIRSGKLPDPDIIPNAGSYFTNPILKNKKASILKKLFPEVPQFHFKRSTKISASWLIENTGLKGAKIGKVKIHSKNSLILINPNHVGFEEIIRAENIITQKVFQKFGIRLEREPRII